MNDAAPAIVYRGETGHHVHGANPSGPILLLFTFAFTSTCAWAAAPLLLVHGLDG